MMKTNKSRGTTENVALEKMKIILGEAFDDKHNDSLLRTFLIASDYDVSKASQMLLKRQEWRASVGADSILKNYKPTDLMKKYFMGGIVGTDKDGRVLIVQKYGKMDFKGLLKCASRKDIIKHHIFLTERIFQKFREIADNKDVWENVATAIVDFDGLGWKSFNKPGVSLFIELLKIVETNYPCMSHRIFFVNAVSYFKIAYNLVSPVFSKQTTGRIKIFGGDFEQELVKYIDKDELPVEYGGTKTGPEDDPLCSDLIAPCGKIPKTFYRTLDQSNSKELQLVANVPTFQELKLDRPPATLQWQINTDGNTISFSIQFKHTYDEEPVEVLPPTTVISQHVPENGYLLCKERGTYVLRFDMSWWFSRKTQLYYTASFQQVTTKSTPETEE